MKQSLPEFYKTSVKDYFSFIFNLLIFFPYYFSILNILKTLFSPWKNLVQQKKVVGFDIHVMLSNLSFNLISRGMGLTIRSTMLLIYFIVQALFIIFLPIFTILFFLLIPIIYILSLFKEDEIKIKNREKENFVKKHLLNHENLANVESWFEDYYQKYLKKNPWWSINNLFSTPPMARDWAVGYTPNLEKYTAELTIADFQNQTKHIIDREREIKEIEMALLKSEGANVLIVGDSGVGKHTIVNALSKKIYEGRINKLLAYKRILKLNMELVLSEFTDLKKRENFLDELFNEAIRAGNIILMIEDFDKYISDGDDRINISQSIKKHGNSPKFQILGITTPFAYQKFIYPNNDLVKLFNKVDVYEINNTEAKKILLNAAPELEFRYKFIIPYETVINTLEKSDFFITNIPFPEKSMELLDATCAYLVEKKHGTTVMPEMIDEVLSNKTHILTTLTEETKNKLINLEKLLEPKIIKQKQAILDIASAIRRAYLLLGKRKKPLASFLFLGPTGVGKTETAKVLATVFFGSDKNLNRLDMSLYQSKADIPKLIGSIETGEVGLLTEAVRKNPYGVLLLDEIEKADNDLLNIFLTVLDEGYFTDGTGRKVDCKNLIVIATSNAGSDKLYNMKTQLTSKDLVGYLIEQHFFSPEFLNRFDSIDVYLPLDEIAIIQVAKKMLNKIISDIYKLHKVRLNISDNTIKELAQKGYDSQFGARNMERLIRTEIEDKAAKLILANQAKSGDSINL